MYMGRKTRVKVTSHHQSFQDFENLICIGIHCREDKVTLPFKEITEENGDKKIFKKPGSSAPLNVQKRDGHFR